MSGARLRILLGLALGSLASLATAQFVITVDDDPSNDTPFQNGGNFTGARSVQDAIAQIHGDATITGPYEVHIVDTDGVADTYTGGFTMTKNNGTLVQDDNPAIDDAPATLVGDGSWVPNNLPAFFIQAEGCSVRGISPAKRLKLNSGTHSFNGGLNAANGTTANWENIEYVNGGTCDFDHIDFNPPAAVGHQVFRGCRFVHQNGPNVQVDGTLFENCVFDSPGYKMVAHYEGGTFTITGSTLNPSALGPNVQEGTTLNITNSHFNGVPRIVQGVAPQGFTDTSTMNITSCTFSGVNGDVAFWLGPKKGTVTVTDCVLDQVAAVLTARLTAGSLTFTSCTIKTCAIDTSGDIDADGATLTFDRCTVIGAAVGPGATAGSAGPLRIRAINSVFNPAGLGEAISTDTDSTIADDIQTTHCTFYGTSANILIGTDGSDTIQSWYTIWDASKCASTSANGTHALTGVGNIVNPNGFIAVPSDTLNAAARLDADGRPMARSAAINHAVGSTMAIDRDGTARPQGTLRDTGAFEVGDLTTPFATYEAAHATVAPVIDGTIDDVTEWQTTRMEMTSETMNLYGGTRMSVDLGGGTPSTGNADISASVWMMWDATNLYVAARVNDSDVNYLRNQGEALNSTDIFQFCTDHQNLRTGDTSTPGIYIHDIAPGQSTNHNTAAYWQHWPTDGSGETGSYPGTFPNAHFAGRAITGGYEVELSLKWTDFTPNAPAPAIGTQMGYLALLCDYDGGALQDLWWNGGGGSNVIASPSGWNTLKLVDALVHVNAASHWDLME